METLHLFRYCSVLKNSWKNINVTTRTALNLAHKIHGPSPTQEGVPIIVVHGLLHCKRNWDSVCNAITSTTKKTVIAVDVRNHGDSPHHNSHTYFDLASDVSQLITTLSVSKACVVGHSMGGRTAMVLALTEPSKVASLVSVDISPISTPSMLTNYFPKLIDAMRSVNFQGAESLSKAKIAAKDEIITSGLIKSMHGMSYVLKNIGIKSDKSFGWISNLDALKENIQHIVSFPAEMTGKEYTGPTLFIGGESSDFIPPGDTDGIKKFFPKSEIKYIPGVGHDVHNDDPTSLIKIFVSFLSTIVVPSPAVAKNMHSIVVNCWYGLFVDAYRYSTSYLLLTIFLTITSFVLLWIYEKPQFYKLIFRRSKHSNNLSPDQSNEDFAVSYNQNLLDQDISEFTEEKKDPEHEPEIEELF